MNKLTIQTFLATALATFTISNSATAHTPQAVPPVFGAAQELCALHLANEDQVAEKFSTIDVLDIKRIQSLAPAVVALVNQHIIDVEYTTQALSFAEIQELFLTGDQSHNDLYIATLKSKSTGKIFIEVKSWPGENQYSLIFDGDTNQVLAKESDGSIELHKGQLKFSCEESL